MLDDKKIAIIKERVRLSYSEMHNFQPLTLPAKELKNGERNLNSYITEEYIMDQQKF